jgi:predicted esterase YcpF (UPF0227 family)
VILYLHGFTSGPQSFKAQALRDRIAARGLGNDFVCPQLPAAPTDAISLAESVIAEKVSHGGTPAVVGSSLGGYYAGFLAEKHGLKAVLVNPAVAGSMDVRQFVGPQRFLYTGEAFEFTLDHVEQLKALDVPKPTRPERYWLLVETGDEVLDYRAAVARYAGARQTVLTGGDHSFTRWTDYLDDVIEFCQ